MTFDPIASYLSKTSEMLAARHAGDEDLEGWLLEQLDDLWYSMSEPELDLLDALMSNLLFDKAGIGLVPEPGPASENS